MRTPVALPPSSQGKERAITKRRRFEQSIPLKDRLSAFISAMRERAELIPPGPERDELLKKARNAEAAVEMDGWVNSSELQPPK